MRVDRLLGEHGIQEDSAAGRQRFEQWMERRGAEETDPQALSALRRGWCVGGEDFRSQLLLRMQGNLGDHHSGELHRQAARARAEQILAEELARRDWGEAELKRRPKNDPDKLEMAARLRRETTLSVKDIAARVHLGTSKGANANLHRHMRRGSPPGANPALPGISGAATPARKH